MSLFHIQTTMKRAADGARMADINREVSDISGTVDTLSAEIEKIRARGYAFASYLENKAAVIQKNWEDIRHRVHEAIQREAEDLSDELRNAERHMTKVEKLEDNAEKLEAVLPDVEAVVDALEAKVREAESRVRAIYETLSRDIHDTESRLHKINWYCDRKDEASFDFLAGEALFMAAEAEWVQTGKGNQDPDGIIFLTDQRLVFEQKEKVGKRLGMFGGKEVHEVEWEIPLHQVEEVTAENKGMFGGKDMLYFTLGSGAPHSKITVEVKGGVDSKFWMKQINRMIQGAADDERAIEPDPELVEQLRNAPSACHVCGGMLPMLVAGQNQIECQYCGTIIRF